jgi:hypothetical protein
MPLYFHPYCQNDIGFESMLPLLPTSFDRSVLSKSDRASLERDWTQPHKWQYIDPVK